MTGDESDRSSLKPDFQDGLKALESAASEREPPVDDDVRPIDTHGSNVVVRLGVWPTDRYRAAGVEYDHDEYVLFVQIPKNFPTGGGKGFITSPPLERRDQGGLENNPWNDSLAQVVEGEVDGQTEAYSYNWEHASMGQPEDMARFLDVADEFLSRG